MQTTYQIIFRNKTLSFAIFVSLLFTFKLSLLSKEKKYQYDLSVCTIFRDEAPYLKEWIEFHRLVGVKHFYLFNNLSKDNYKEVLKPYVKTGIVQLIDWPYETIPGVSNWSTIQEEAYDKAVKLAIGKSKWLAVIDSDEFLFPVQVHNCAEFLSDYEEFAGLCVNWQMYGTSNIPSIDSNQLMIDMLTYKAPPEYGENAHVKVIVRPEFIRKFTSAHSCSYKPDCIQVNSDKEHTEGPISSYILVNKIRINHYWTRDEAFFYNCKIKRRNDWNEGNDGIFKRANSLNQVIDESIKKYVPALKKSMDFS